MSAGNWKDMLYAIQNGRLETVKYHIKNGVNPNYEHPEFFTTPLIESILNEEIEIAKYLLENGADPKLKSGFSNESPLQIAAKKNNKELLELISGYTSKNRYSIFGAVFRSIKNSIKF